MRAILATIAPAVLLLWLRYHGLPWPLPAALRMRDVGWGAAAVFIAWGAVRLADRPREGRTLATIGVVGGSVLLIGDLWAEPAVAFPLLVGAAGLLVRIWPVGWSSEPHRPGNALSERAFEARASAWVALAAWAIAVPSEWCARRSSALILASVIGVSGWYAARWSLAERQAGGRRWIAIAGGAVGGATGLAFAAQSPLVASAVLLLVPLGALVGAVPRREVSASGGADLTFGLLDHPARLVSVVFLALAVWGGAVLSLPVCARTGAIPMSFVDAVFTAVSASCLTGLSVRNISEDLSFFGQIVVLGLAQAGALGILGLSAAASTLLGQRRTVDPDGLQRGASSTRDALLSALRRVLAVTLAVEAAGAAVLTYLLSVAGEPFQVALWQGTFTAISAFSSAGFTAHSDSLMRFAEDPLVLHTVAVLSILGGLGPAVVAALPTWAMTRRASVHTRLAVWTSLALLVAPAVWIAVVEQGRSLASLGFFDLIHHAWFTSASLRSGGFSSVDITAFHPATLLVMMGAMFIGGAPGSTAGGLTTTTFALLFVAVVAALRGERDASAFGRRFPAVTIYRAAAIASLAVASVFVALAALLVTQEIEPEVALFEVISALGTVGFSLGGTARLDEIGKFILVVCMFVGRVGPLTLFLLLAEPRRGAAAALPQQDVAMG